jgi:hypothetical protein
MFREYWSHTALSGIVTPLGLFAIATQSLVEDKSTTIKSRIQLCMQPQVSAVCSYLSVHRCTPAEK